MTPSRPPLPPAPVFPELPWERHVDIGLDVAFVARPASAESQGGAAGIRYRPTIGVGAHARWDIFRYLRFTTYFVGANHDIFLPPGALGPPGVIESESAETIAFGARFSPTLPLTEWARVWLAGGIGYGRFEFPRMQIAEPGSPKYSVRERAESFAEIPIGLGISVDVIPNWLALEHEVTGAFLFGQGGDSTEPAQAIDYAGRRRTIAPLPELDASFVQTLGLSVLL